MAKSHLNIAGVDEAGRGPLAGPVVVVACQFLKQTDIEGIDDSKKLSRRKRRIVFERLVNDPNVDFSVVKISVEEIDNVNILQATMLGMQRAVEGLRYCPLHVYIDGNRAPDLKIPVTTVVGGDALYQCISAASIIAKESRDQYMEHLAERFPQYQFEKHKGYSTKLHKKLLQQHGPCEYHRRSFGPVRGFYEE